MTIKIIKSPKLPETFTSMKAKMNNSVSDAIDAMNLALTELCQDKDNKYSPRDKLKATQDYLALYMRLDNEIQREKDSKENYKQNKLTTIIKQHQVDLLENPNSGNIPTEVMQSKFSPIMGNSVN